MLYRGEDSADHVLPRARGDQRAVGQSRRPLPGRRAAVRSRYSFEARPWELRKVPAIDVMDAVGTNIRLDVRQRQVMRVLPRINEDVNEEWIARQDAPPCRRAGPRPARPAVGAREGQAARGELGRGARAVRQAAARRPGTNVAAIAGDLLDAETMYAAKELLEGQGSTLLEGRQTGLDYDVTSLAAVRVQLDHRRDRECRRDPAGRHQPALGSAAGQHPAAQGGAQGRRKVFAIGPEVDLAYGSTGSATI